MFGFMHRLPELRHYTPMFIAHAPSGYLLAAALSKRAQAFHASTMVTVLAAVAGGLAPDLDLFYFYLLDGRQTPHHKYMSHWPFTWLLVLGVSVMWSYASRARSAFLLAVFSLGCILHVFLDSIVGGIWWFAPFLDRRYVLVVIPAVYTPWWLNFILHWSFALELGICLAALVVYRMRLLRERGSNA